MAKTLAELQSDIEAHEAAATPGTASEAIFGVLLELVTILQQDKAPQSDKACDAKVADLNAKLSALSQQLNNQLNHQAQILQATKDALHIGQDKTMAQMPDIAAGIYADSQKWKDTIK